MPEELARPPSYFDLERTKAIQGAADQPAGDRAHRIVAASIVIAVVSIVAVVSIIAVATTTVSIATAVTAPTGKVTSAVTAAGLTSHRMSTHRVTSHGVTSHGMTGVPSAAVTSSMSGRQGPRERHATKGDCGGESDQCATKHLTLP